MTPARRLARAQLGLNIADLESLNARRGALQAALAEAQAVLEQALPDTAVFRAAKADLDALHPEISAVDRLRDISLLEIQRQQRYFARTLLEAFPHELLSAIFLQVVAEPDDYWDESILVDGSYNSARNRAPFVLAAVCGRWRSIAMEVAGLWAYIGVPYLVGKSCTTHDIYLDRIQALLERSKYYPLDITLDWCNHGSLKASWLDCAHYRLIFDAVGNHIGRWRRVQLILPAGLSDNDITRLHAPAPMLVDLSILSSDDSDGMLAWSNEPRYLPICPQLQSLCATKFFVAPDHPLPFLRGLYIRIDKVPADIFWDLLRHSPAVETLILLCSEFQPDHVLQVPPHSCINLPRMTTFGIYWDLTFLSGTLDSISMPALKVLRIFTNSIEDLPGFPGPMLDKVSTLVVIGPFEVDVVLVAEAAAHLAALQNVEQFELMDCEKSTEGLFGAILENGQMWPKLHSVRIEDCAFGQESAEAFMQLVQSRSALRADTGLPPLKVSLIDVATPSWLKEDIRATFGDTAIQSSGFAEVESTHITL